MQTFLTPYYSSSRGWAILLYESLEWKIDLALNDFCWFFLAFSIRFMKNQFFSLFSLFSFFFSKNVKKFVRIFDLAITYRRTRDPQQINHSEKLSPNINSNRNLSGWSLIKNSHFRRKFTDMSQALWMQTFLTPYYSSSRGWAILLYESFLIYFISGEVSLRVFKWAIETEDL